MVTSNLIPVHMGDWSDAALEARAVNGMRFFIDEFPDGYVRALTLAQTPELVENLDVRYPHNCPAGLVGGGYSELKYQYAGETLPERDAWLDARGFQLDLDDSDPRWDENPGYAPDSMTAAYARLTSFWKLQFQLIREGKI
jgi:hypothetical protein